MATSSFDTVVKITKKSVKSLERILSDDARDTVDLRSETKIEKVSANRLESILNRKKTSQRKREAL